MLLTVLIGAWVVSREAQKICEKTGVIAAYLHLQVVLLQFSVSNFRSFRKLQTLNLAASGQDKSLPENCIEAKLPGLSQSRWLKGVAIYGANASGKTTLIEALKALAEMVSNSAKATDPREPIVQIEPFALSLKESLTPTAFEVVFVADDMRFAYRVAATRERVWHESLRAYPTAKAQTWFSRDWNPDTEEYGWGPERPVGFSRDSRLEKDTLSNVLFLSKHIASNRAEFEPVFRWFKQRLQFLHLDVNWSMDEGFSLRQLQEETGLRDRILQLLRHADLGVTGARAVEQPAPKELLDTVAKMPTSLQDRLREQLKGPFVAPELTHRGADNADIPLPWDLESAGTHRLFALAGPWLDILSEGHVVCIDELDTSMHPLMVMELLRLLFVEKYSSNRAQVIFTTHNPLLLDITLLRRDQVWFTDKDNHGEGHLYPLTEYAPRKEESLIRGYLSGRYGAVPFLPKGLLGERPAFEVHGRRDMPKRRVKTSNTHD